MGKPSKQADLINSFSGIKIEIYLFIASFFIALAYGYLDKTRIQD